MSIINDKFLVDIIKEYQTPTKEKFINFLSNLSKQEVIKLINETKIDIYYCDSCGKDNRNKYCNGCHIIKCVDNGCAGIYIHKCYECKLTYCEECIDYINIGGYTWKAFCNECNLLRTKEN